MINPLLLTDFQKTIHHKCYAEGLTKLVSYWTPRLSRKDNIDKVVMFGLQPFIKKYLIEYFNENFFNQEAPTSISGEQFTKSQKGMCYVYRDGENIIYEDELTIKEVEYKEDNLLKTVYKDGKLMREHSLKEIRKKLHRKF